MKAIIAQINKRHAVAICKNGDFIKIKSDKSYEVGDRIDLPTVTHVNFSLGSKLVPIAAAIAVVFMLSIGTYAYYKPNNYINIDINPSVEIVTNMFNKIIDVKALNKDGERIISQLDYANTSTEECMKLILDLAVLKGYMSPSDNNTIMITVTNVDNNNTENMSKSLKNAATSEMDKIDVDTSVIVDNASMKSHDAAINKGKSLGRQMILDKLISENPNMKVKDYENTSTDKIVEKSKKIKKVKKTEKENNASDNNTNKNKKKVATPTPTPDVITATPEPTKTPKVKKS